MPPISALNVKVKRTCGHILRSRPIDVCVLLYYCTVPSIAQLVERWTVVVICQTSIGRWFKSGSKDFLKFFCHKVGKLTM